MGGPLKRSINKGYSLPNLMPEKKAKNTLEITYWYSKSRDSKTA